MQVCETLFEGLVMHPDTLEEAKKFAELAGDIWEEITGVCDEVALKYRALAADPSSHRKYLYYA